MWNAAELEEELKKAAQRAREMTNLPISASDMGFKLANDLKSGKIKLIIPEPIKRHNQLFIKIGNQNVQKKKQKR